MRLKEKVAIITGAGGGIGRHFALGFGREGAKLAIADIDLAKADETADALRKEGAEACSIKTDVSNPESAEELAKKTIEHFGRIDILVNNAAILATYSPLRGPFYQLDLDEWDRVMAVNVKGAFLCIRAVFPYMKAQGKGKIINTASTSVLWGATGNAHYVASKGGLIGLSRALAREMGEYNINVNCIAPGSTSSEEPSNQVALEFRQRAIPRRAIQRLEVPEDLVGTAIFLASPDSDFITGQTIVVDGGHIMR